MKFVISSAVLSAKLLTVGRVIASKNSLPILDCFLFQIEGNKLTITASDNETRLTTWVDLVESDQDITFAVNAKKIQDSIKEIPEQPLEFYVNTSTLEITVEYQNGKYNFMGQNADDYPTPPQVEGEARNISIPSVSLSSALGRALFATADDTLRPVMNGVFFDIKNDSVTIVASDGHKLACGKILNVASPEDGSFILPKKPANLIKAILQKEDGDVTISFGERNALVRGDSFTINCRLIEGRYPNYNSVIPQNNENCATVNRLAFLGALRRVMIFSNASSALVKLRFENSKMVISSQDIDFSMSAEEAILCDYTGIPMSIGFKGTFLMDLLNNLDSEEIIVKLADSSRAGIIVPAEQPDGENVLMLLMPMMLND